MKKRLTATVMTVAMIAGCLSACGGNDSNTNSKTNAGTSGSETTANAAADSDEVVTIKYVTWESKEENNPIIEQFEKEHSNIKVDVTVVPDSNNTAESLDIIAMGGGEMDVWPFQSGGQFSRMQQGLLLDVSSYLERDGIDMDEWFGTYSEWGQYNGTYYGMPSTASVGMMFYNKDMFDAAGVDYPADDWTIDDYKEIAEKLTTGDGSSKVYGTFQNTFPEEWGIYGAQKTSLYGEDGLSSFTMDNTDFINSLQLRKELDDGGYEISYAQNVANFSYSSVEFLSGRCAMTPGYSWVIRDMKDKENFPFDFNVGVCYFPRISEDAPMNPSQVSVGMLGIPASAEHPDEAWEFIKYYTQYGSAQTISDGNIPTYQGSDNSALVEELIKDTPLTKEQGELFFADDIYTFTAVPTGVAAGEYSTIINEETGLYFSGEQSLEDTINNIKTKADEAIKAAQ
jgi:multiple sugar transport system substrate-binding protein